MIEIVETLKPIYADFGTKDHVRLVAIRHQLASVGPLVLDEKHEADELTLNQFRPTARQFDHYLATDGRLAGPRTPTRAMMAAERLTRDNTISNTLRCATLCHSSIS